MQEIPYNQYLKEITDVLPQGAFLTVKVSKLVNTMTIGWGTIGYIWGKPILMVVVRKSRYTYKLIEKADEFTVSFPLNGVLKNELNFCGSKSGRDYDKIKECKLILIPGHRINTPVIDGCKFYYECKIRFKQEMKEDNLNPVFNKKWYSKKDFHTLYFGEIVSCYLDEKL